MTEPAPSQSTMRRDVISAYFATGARVASWAIVAAVVMREFGTAEFALLALVRAALSILNYGTLGLGPAMIHHLTRQEPSGANDPREAVPVLPAEAQEIIGPPPAAALAYANPTDLADPLRQVLYPLRSTYAAGLRIALVAGVFAAIALLGYALNFDRIHDVPGWISGIHSVRGFVLMMGIGAILRLISEAPSAVLQVNQRLATDNLYQAAAEAVWVLGVLVSMIGVGTGTIGAGSGRLEDIGLWFLLSGAVLLIARLTSAAAITRQFLFDLPRPPPGTTRALLTDGAGIVLGQLANYFYAPAVMIIINRMLDPDLVAYYEAGVQVDAALLLLVSSIAAVLLPKTAVAHAADDQAAVRRYYVRGTLGTFSLLAIAAIVAVITAQWVYPLWLGQEMRATRAILPMLLVSTIVGGSGMVGRSILLGMGKVKAFTISSLIAGVANVGLAILMVKLGYGLRGIVTATAIVVIARAGVWLPWYVMSTLRVPR